MKHCIAILAVATAALAQQPLTFEVASIKPSDPQPMGMMRIGMNSDAGMVRYSNVSLKDCIRTAYRVKDFQVQGPDWLEDARFDITAKLPPGSSENQIPEMLQTLLAERFRLTIRRDSREDSVYALTVGKAGAKLQPAEAEIGDKALKGAGPDGKAPPPLGPDGKPRQAMMMQFQSGGSHMRAPAATIALLAEMLSRFTERPVIDMTGIEGQYSFDLTFTPETMRRMPGGGMPMNHTPDTPSEPAPTIADAVQQYGLKLEARKAPMDLIVVTHAEKTPTEN